MTIRALRLLPGPWLVTTVRPAHSHTEESLNAAPVPALDQSSGRLSDFGINERYLTERLHPEGLAPGTNGVDLILAQALSNQRATDLRASPKSHLLTKPASVKYFQDELHDVDNNWILCWTVDIVSRMVDLSPAMWQPILPLTADPARDLGVKFADADVALEKALAMVTSSIDLLMKLRNLETANFVAELGLTNVQDVSAASAVEIVRAISSGHFDKLDLLELRAMDCVLLASALRGSQFGRFSAAADEMDGAVGLLVEAICSLLEGNDTQQREFKQALEKGKLGGWQSIDLGRMCSQLSKDTTGMDQEGLGQLKPAHVPRWAKYFSDERARKKSSSSRPSCVLMDCGSQNSKLGVRS